jgi:CcmD family protein
MPMTRPTRFHRLAAVIAAAFALSIGPSAAPASAQTTTSRAEAAVSQPAAGGVLPGEQAPAPPRTLRAYWHVFIAFALAWLFLFGYAVSLGRRFRKLEQDVDALRGTS